MQTMETGKYQEGGRKANQTRSSNDSARPETGSMTTRFRRGDTKPTAKFAPPKDSVLLVRRLGAGAHAGISSEETLKLVANQIDPVQLRIAMRGTRHISGGDVAFLTNSADDLIRLVEVLVSTVLSKDLEVVRLRRRNPEVILLGRVLDAIQEQNEALTGASLELRSVFVGNRNRNMILSVDEGSIERFSGLRRLN